MFMGNAHSTIDRRVPATIQHIVNHIVTGLSYAFIYYPYSGAELDAEIGPHLPLMLRSRTPTHLDDWLDCGKLILLDCQ